MDPTCVSVVYGSSFQLSGDIFLDGGFIQLSGTVTFNNSVIHVGVGQIAVNASCVASDNSTIIVDSNQAGTIDLFSYGASCSTNFTVIVWSTSLSDCTLLQGEIRDFAVFHFC